MEPPILGPITWPWWVRRRIPVQSWVECIQARPLHHIPCPKNIFLKKKSVKSIEYKNLQVKWSILLFGPQTFETVHSPIRQWSKEIQEINKLFNSKFNKTYFSTADVEFKRLSSVSRGVNLLAVGQSEDVVACDFLAVLGEGGAISRGHSFNVNAHLCSKELVVLSKEKVLLSARG